ncbi:hypothetical protein ACG96_20825 [Rhodococcoides fascians]|nr:hypothetical protein ACG96_20825 [Rhodococcus fascians]
MDTRDSHTALDLSKVAAAEPEPIQEDGVIRELRRQLIRRTPTIDIAPQMREIDHAHLSRRRP